MTTILQFKGEAAGLTASERNAQKLPDLNLIRQFDRHFIREEPVERKVYGNLYEHTSIDIKELRGILALN